MILAPEERIKYNKKMNAERVRKHRDNNKEHALEYNRECKFFFILEMKTKRNIRH